MTAGLTPQQDRLLTFIADRIATTGQSPTVSEMSEGMGMSGKGSIMGTLARLEERGMIRRLPYKARSVTVITAVPTKEDLKRLSAEDFRELKRRVEIEDCDRRIKRALEVTG